MTVYFPDVSGWNGPPYKPPLDMKGAIIVQAKATEGTYYYSSCHEVQKAEAANHGTYFVAYHWLTPGNTQAQAQFCHSKVGKVPLSIDVELLSGHPAPTMADVCSFTDAYRKLGGVVHLIYLPRWFWQGTWGSPSLQPLIDRKLYLHSSAYTTYTDNSSGIGWQPYGGMTPQYWQYSDRVQFNGQAVDFSAYRGHNARFAGKQDPASVAACLKDFKAMAEGGTPRTAHHASYEGSGKVYFEVDGHVNFKDGSWHVDKVTGVHAPSGPHPSFQHATGRAYFRAGGRFDLDHGTWGGNIQGRPAPK